jgi:hypothetical protein
MKMRSISLAAPLRSRRQRWARLSGLAGQTLLIEVGFETDGGGAIYGNDKRTDGPMPQPALFGQAAGNRIAVTG